jgi:hypothetical protein
MYFDYLTEKLVVCCSKQETNCDSFFMWRNDSLLVPVFCFKKHVNALAKQQAVNVIEPAAAAAAAQLSEDQ